VAAAHRLQPRRDVPLLSRGGAGHEAPAERQDREHLLHRRTGTQPEQQQRLRRRQGWDELGPFGVTVNAIAPSLTLTERIRLRWEQRTAEEQAQEIARTPLRRVAEARDQARVICFLASRDADFVTGVTIDVTGGL
jgi:hypothetical protein